MEEAVDLSVQGALFRLKKNFILSHDWLVATMLTTEIGSNSPKDVLYLDVDPNSFRMLLLNLQERLDLGEILPKLSMIELTLLRTSAEYLLLLDVSSTIARFEENAKNEIRQLKEEVNSMERYKFLYEQKTEQIEQMMNLINKEDVQIVTCHSFRTCRSYNRCDCNSIVIGPITCNKDKTYECSKGCDPKARASIHKLKKMKSLTTLFENLRSNDHDD